MANILNAFLDNVLSGTSNPKGNLGDAQHAARLYTDDAFRLAPKTKFLYHVVLELSPSATKQMPQLDQRHKHEISMLVKSVDLPKYSVNTITKNMYNRKKNVQTSIEYDPINIVFHDDNLGLTTALMEAYYRYYYVDGNHATDGLSPAFASRNTYAPPAYHNHRYGFDNNSLLPFFTKITIFQLSRHQYTSFTLVNPLITGFQHDTMDQSDASGTVQNSITVAYEAVFYGRGATGENSPKGFATQHYDKTPSPLGIRGGGTTSLFGQGGVVSGVSSILGDIAGGQFNLGTAIDVFNVYKNTKSLSKEGLRQEGFKILSGAIGAIGREGVSGITDTNFPKNSGTGNAVINAAGGTTDSSSASYQAKIAQAQSNIGDLP